MALTIVGGKDLCIICQPHPKGWRNGALEHRSCWEADADVAEPDGRNGVFCVVMTAERRCPSDRLDDFVWELFGGLREDARVRNQAAFIDFVLRAIVAECRNQNKVSLPRVTVSFGRGPGFLIDTDILTRLGLMAAETDHEVSEAG